jgi:hypothetical protein
MVTKTEIGGEIFTITPARLLDIISSALVTDLIRQKNEL